MQYDDVKFVQYMYVRIWCVSMNTSLITINSAHMRWLSSIPFIFTAGEDYVSINGAMLTFAPFTNIVCTNLTITDDEVEEEDEVFMIEVSSLTEKAISDQSAVLVTIKDDDCELISMFLSPPHL